MGATSMGVVFWIGFVGSQNSRDRMGVVDTVHKSPSLWLGDFMESAGGEGIAKQKNKAAHVQPCFGYVSYDIIPY